MDAQSFPQPDEDTVLRHLTLIHGVGGIPWDCRLATAFANVGTGALDHGRLYELDDLETAAADAVSLNAVQGASGYYVPSLVTPDASRRPSDRHFLGTWWLWGDLDAADAVAQAKTRWASAPPTLIVVTGKIPHYRIQALWRLTVMVEDADYVRAMLGGICDGLEGDPKVANPTSLMRLAGTVAWPWKAGRSVERTFISPQSRLDAEYDPEALESVFPPVAVHRGHNAPRTHQPRTGLGFSDPKVNAAGKVTDGRHQACVDLVFRHFLAWCGEHGFAPSANELFDDCWPEYEASIDLDRPGRAGAAYLRSQCGYTVRRFERGHLPGVPDLEAAAARDQEWRRERQQAEDRIRSAQGGKFKLWNGTELDDIQPPDFLIDGWLLKQGIAMMWGAPGAYKSFVLLDMALSVAAGVPWAGHDIDAPGDVVYFAPEGFSGIASQRVPAWCKTRNMPRPERFWLAGDGFRFPSDLGDMVKDIEAAGIAPRLIAIDTLSKTVEGKENDDDVMRAYTKGADGLARHFGCLVTTVHHSGKDEDRGPRGHSSLHGDWDVSIHVQRVGDESVRVAHYKAKDFEEQSLDMVRVNVSLGERTTVKADGTEKTRTVSSLAFVPIGADQPRAKVADEGVRIGKNERTVLAAIERCHEQKATLTTLRAMLRDMNSGSLNRALNALVEKGKLVRRETEAGRSFWQCSGCV